ncbi:MAG TPA: hypothetical protein VGX28_04255 [Frankiaceae bacterium]|jgi:hypothetical protein|nr:hypothetical protein [Frankiaceae bacterium]
MPALRRALRVAVLAAALVAPPAYAADRLCTAPAKDALPVGTTACPGVRPGSGYLSAGEVCTFAFLFQGSDRRRYAATAGHCAFDPDVDATKVWRNGSGPVVTDAAGKRLGTFAYAVLDGQFRDFGLIRLDSGVASDPAMCHFGGPTGIDTTVSGTDLLVHHYGQGTGLDYLPARTGEMFFGLYRPDYVYFYGAASVGDSGGPVTTDDGAAIGVLTDLTTPFTGNVGVNRLAPHLSEAQRALRVRLSLLTAPVA